jgi:hypothetical protein
MSTPIATIQSITLSPDGSGSGINYQCTVVFSDVTTGYSQTKTYAFPSTAAIAADRAAIQADLNAIKAAVAAAGNITGFVGTVLT